MKQKTKTMLQSIYTTAVERSDDIMGILDNLFNLLKAVDISTIPDEDVMQFDSLIKGVYTSKMIRKNTFKLTNLVVEMSTTICYIIIWLNFTKKMNIDLSLTGRRKALETELAKILDNAKDDPLACIHDRFGLRGILLNNLPEDVAIPLIRETANYVISILTRTDSRLYMEFFQWLSENENIDKLTKYQVCFILELPFNLITYKDYITDLKPGSNYQSLHYILQLDMFSPYLAGAEIELQWRTHEMHKRSLDDNYTKNRRPNTRNIFKIQDFSKTQIVGFTGYKRPDDDLDGIHFAKKIVDRRISSSLVNI